MPVYHYDEIKHNHINLALFRHDLLSRHRPQTLYMSL